MKKEGWQVAWLIFLFVAGGVLLLYGMMNRFIHLQKYPFQTAQLARYKRMAYLLGVLGGLSLALGIGLFLFL